MFFVAFKFLSIYGCCTCDFPLIGAPGLRGKPGPRGAQGVKGDSGGTVYTRWGRSDCPKSVKTQLYSGICGFVAKSTC